MFYMTYIQCLDKTQNAFAEWGSFGHLLFEKYYKKELEFFELSSEYVKKYDNNVKTKFPPNPHVDLNKSYYDKGKEYFDSFEGLFDDCEILGIEENLKLKIGKYDFIGYIDLVLRNEDGIIIVDHKSKSKFKSKLEKKEMLIQLYLYAIHIYEKYQEYPKKLIFNMFRANEVVEEKFDVNELENAKKWVENTIDDIYKDMEFKCIKNNFFCNWLCSVNSYCKCSDKYLGE